MENMEKMQLNMLPQKKNATISLPLGNGATVLVKETIPYEELFEMITWSLRFVIDDRAYVSGPVYKVVKDLAMIRYYTNIDLSFLDGEEVNPKEIYENYDLLANAEKENGESLMDGIRTVINEKQLSFYADAFELTVNNIIKYRDSARGVVNALAESSKVDAATIEEALEVMGDDEKMKQARSILNFYTDNA